MAHVVLFTLSLITIADKMIKKTNIEFEIEIEL